MVQNDRQPTLRPSDVVVACQLALVHGASFAVLAESTGLSAGECHNSVRRLISASLLIAKDRKPAGELLHRFLVHGAPHAFPPVLGPNVLGIPTAQSAPVLEGLVVPAQRFVWPDADGTIRGGALTPLYPQATRLPGRNPALYDLLALVDTLRIGQARERQLAAELLGQRILGAPIR